MKGHTIHTWSDGASNYFVSWGDDIKPGSIPGNTCTLSPPHLSADMRGDFYIMGKISQCSVYLMYGLWHTGSLLIISINNNISLLHNPRRNSKMTLFWACHCAVLSGSLPRFVFQLSQISCTLSTQLLHSFDSQTQAILWIYCITSIHTWVAILCSNSRMGPSQSRPGGRLTPSSRLNMLPTQFYLLWPTRQHVVCSNGSYFTRLTLSLQLL